MKDNNFDISIFDDFKQAINNSKNIPSDFFLSYFKKLDNFDKLYASKIFSYGKSSLKQLPDISKWSTNNLIDMDGLFYGCKSVLSLPDISNWETNNVINMSGIDVQV